MPSFKQSLVGCSCSSIDLVHFSSMPGLIHQLHHWLEEVGVEAKEARAVLLPVDESPDGDRALQQAPQLGSGKVATPSSIMLPPFEQHPFSITIVMMQFGYYSSLFIFTNRIRYCSYLSLVRVKLIRQEAACFVWLRPS